MIRPRADLARAAGLKLGKGILVDEHLCTSAPDVFAAGDVAEALDPVHGTTALDVLWPTALAQGKIAGANMAGATQPYVKGIPFNVTMLTGLKVAIIGSVGSGSNDDLVTITRGESEAWRQTPAAALVSAHDEVNRLRLFVGERRLIGALVMGEQSWARPLQRLILAQADIAPIRPALAAGGPAALTALANFYRDWERAQAPALTPSSR